MFRGIGKSSKENSFQTIAIFMRFINSKLLQTNTHILSYTIEFSKKKKVQCYNTSLFILSSCI